MPLKLLHLSDIHFKHFDGKTFLDHDVEIRNELERDLARLKAKIGTIDVVLVGGDVAFSGKEEEYVIADSWLKKICGLVECSVENVLTIPGNHDVDREKVCPIVKTVHSEFKRMNSRNQIDSKLKEFLESPDSYTLLSKPLNNYLNFAQKFGTVPANENPLIWEKDFTVDNSVLRIRGINSAIVSNDTDHRDKSKLIVGSLQTMLLREDGVIYLALCHHPPDWLIDGEDVETDLNATAQLHLFGHKHKLKVTQVGQSLRLAAGAMQPSRNEQDWEPRYNIVQIGVEESASKCVVNVEVWKRVWNKDSKVFRPDVTDDGDEVHKFMLTHSSTRTAKPKDKIAAANPTKKGNGMSTDIEKIDPSSPNPLRKLAYMFLGLPYHKKIAVASSLNLIEDSDRNLSEVQRSQSYILRAKEREQLEELWNRTVDECQEKPQMENPFKK